MKHTSNYSYKQPERTASNDDVADINDLADNWGRLDGDLKSLSDAQGATQASLATHIANKANPHGVTLTQLGGISAEEADAKVAVYESHVRDRSNPHDTTAAQVGAYTVGEVNSLLGEKVTLGGGLVGGRVMVANGAGNAVTAAVTTDELLALSGIAENVQAQLDRVPSFVGVRNWVQGFAKEHTANGNAGNNYTPGSLRAMLDAPFSKIKDRNNQISYTLKAWRSGADIGNGGISLRTRNSAGTNHQYATIVSTFVPTTIPTVYTGTYEAGDLSTDDSIYFRLDNVPTGTTIHVSEVKIATGPMVTDYTVNNKDALYSSSLYFSTQADMDAQLLAQNDITSGTFFALSEVTIALVGASVYSRGVWARYTATDCRLTFNITTNDPRTFVIQYNPSTGTKTASSNSDLRYGQLAAANTWTQPQNVPTPTANNHAANKAYVDSALGANSGFPITSPIQVGFGANVANEWYEVCRISPSTTNNLDHNYELMLSAGYSSGAGSGAFGRIKINVRTIEAGALSTSSRWSRWFSADISSPPDIRVLDNGDRTVSMYLKTPITYTTYRVALLAAYGRIASRDTEAVKAFSWGETKTPIDEPAGTAVVEVSKSSGTGGEPSTITAGYGTNSEAFNGITSSSMDGAVGTGSHAEGRGTTANGDYSHAEGNFSIAGGNYSHAEGNNTAANGQSSHAEGNTTIARGNYSHAEGFYTRTNGVCQHVEGKYNGEIAGPVSDSSLDGALHIIGNGTSSSARSNAFRVDADGSIYIPDVSGGITGAASRNATVKLQDVLDALIAATGISF